MKGNVDQGLPAQLSSRPGDRHFDKKAEELSGKIDIYVDGQLLGEAVSYDIVKGEVVRQRRDAEGRPLLDEHDRPTFETLQGLVEVRWIRSAEPSA